MSQISPMLLDVLTSLAKRSRNDSEAESVLGRLVIRLRYRTGLPASALWDAVDRLSQGLDLGHLGDEDPSPQFGRLTAEGYVFDSDPDEDSSLAWLYPVFGRLDAEGFTADYLRLLARVRPELVDAHFIDALRFAEELKRADAAALPPPARHGPDFRSVHWFGADYAFSPTQAACVNVLWQEWEKGMLEIGQEAILDEAGSNGKRLIDVFRDRDSKKGYHPAWGTMIVPGSTKGSFRLNPPKK